MAAPKIRFKKDDGSSYPAWKNIMLGDHLIQFTDVLNIDIAKVISAFEQTGCQSGFFIIPVDICRFPAGTGLIAISPPQTVIFLNIFWIFFINDFYRFFSSLLRVQAIITGSFFNDFPSLYFSYAFLCRFTAAFSLGKFFIGQIVCSTNLQKSFVFRFFIATPRHRG